MPESEKSMRAGSGSIAEAESQQPEDLSEVMDFSRYALRTTIRLVVLSGESRRIEIRRGSRIGSIFVRDGEIYRAVTTDLNGDEALFEILAWDKAVHSDVLQTEPVEKNVHISTNVLLSLMENRASTVE